ncbi:DUF4190 domain-containing protein [Rhodococcus sp. IEGM 1379]|uniref:DUF4190 domain-containing protein n=1 Tax=Rhodococcus sp. IEGM 1379 TaxID=3047086 RepID=UPI0024B8155C|nr:DUF4190 domain-containing protein [Rhodococcus sp. IEGM 1379]MDI9915903.1 DUF4190 domain-containing protein [Rhodococcus sp. IEGM 1379]
MSEQGGYGYPQQQYPQNWQPRPTNTLAVLALVFAFLVAPLGIVFGHIARSQIKRTGEQGDGLALAGLIIGYIFTALGILFFIAWVAFWGLFASAVNEAANNANSSTYSSRANTYSASQRATPTPRTTAPPSTVPRTTTTTAPRVTTTAVGPLPTVTGTDRQGFISNGPSCNANNPAVAVAITTGSRIVVCETGVGRYYYKGERGSDGAVIELDDPIRTREGFAASNGDVVYQLSPSGLVILDGGSEVASESAVEVWLN